MKIIYIIPLLLSLTFLVGCSSQNSLFIESAMKQNNTESESIKLFVDAFGSLYPKEQLASHLNGNKIPEGSLNQLFTSNLLRCDKFPVGSEANQLCKYQMPRDEWRKIQTKMWKNRAKYIYKQATNRELVFLIHGYNNTFLEGDANFNLVKQQVNNLLEKQNRDPLFVDIHWDGHLGSPVSGAWGNAQWSGPLVGFQLRQLFNALSENYTNNAQKTPKITFITHSSGAFVVGSILGNPYFALPELQEFPQNDWDYKYFQTHRHGNDNAGTHKIPSYSEIKVGMFAAATPTTTFYSHTNYDKYNKRTEDVSGILAKNVTLLFSINNRDIALSKLFRIANWNLFGATGAGSEKNRYCSYLDKLPSNRNGVLRVDAIDFEDQNAPFWKLYDQHGLKDNGYFARKASTELFFNALFNDNYSDPTGRSITCT